MRLSLPPVRVLLVLTALASPGLVSSAALRAAWLPSPAHPHRHHRLACDQRHVSRRALRARLPVAPEPPVLQNLSALLQRGCGTTADDGDDVIQTDTLPLSVGAREIGVPVLEPIRTLPRARRNIAQHLRSPRRSPRGPPVPFA